MSEYSEVLHLDGASVLMNDRMILRDIHVVMNQGEFCYLKGETGTGKSSFIKALYGLLKMNGARIYAAGEDLSNLNKKSLQAYRRKLGLISDSYPLFTDQTVFKNLDTILTSTDWAIASERERRITEVLDKLGLGMLQGEIVRDLPSGLRQKVAIARSVLNKPTLLLADNPMVHLDNKSTDDVMALFISLVKENKTSILCSVSDESLIDRYPGRSYFCGDGTVTESM